MPLCSRRSLREIVPCALCSLGDRNPDTELQEYIAVLTGWAGDARGMGNVVGRFFPGEVPSVPEGGQMYVYTLE